MRTSSTAGGPIRLGRNKNVPKGVLREDVPFSCQYPITKLKNKTVKEMKHFNINNITKLISKITNNYNYKIFPFIEIPMLKISQYNKSSDDFLNFCGL